jgi:hypothetical protein
MELVENNPQSIIFHVFQYVIRENSNLKCVEMVVIKFCSNMETIIKKLGTKLSIFLKFLQGTKYYYKNNIFLTPDEPRECEYHNMQRQFP